MKIAQTFFTLLLFIVFSSVNAAFAADDLVANYRFAGTAFITKEPGAENLKKVWALPESGKLRDDVIQKLSVTSLRWLGVNNANQAALLQPLFGDLIAQESRVEVRGKTKAELIFAVQLNAARSQLWETNLQKLTGKSKAQAAKLNEFSGWKVPVAKGNVLHFYRSEKWTVVAFGANHPGWLAEFLKRLERAYPKNSWLEADVDWTRLNSLIPLDFIPFKLARTTVKVEPADDNVRTIAQVIYPEKVNWKQEPWQIPTEAIRDPLISFTAGQKLAPFLKPSKTLQNFRFNPAESQYFFWAQSQMPFQSYFAFPVKNATNVLKAFGPQLAATVNDDLKQRDGGSLNIASNKVDMIWQGLPIIVPYLNATKEKDGSEFLLGGLFPLIRTTNAPPAELFSQIRSQKDLVFYDWEITQVRLSQAMMLSQILPVFPKQLVSVPNMTEKRLVPGKYPQGKWLTAIAPLLGNTITQVINKGPGELDVVRKSHIGLNSTELILLSHWLAHPDFPSRKGFIQEPGGVAPNRPAPPQIK